LTQTPKLRVLQYFIFFEECQIGKAGCVAQFTFSKERLVTCNLNKLGSV